MAYAAEATDNPDYPLMQAQIKLARETMRTFQARAEALARDGFGIPLLKAKRPL
jgi:hypothetical protein